MSKNDTRPADSLATEAAPAVQTYPLLRAHRHAGVEYAAGHEFTAEEWGLTEQQIGWLQGVGTI